MLFKPAAPLSDISCANLTCPFFSTCRESPAPGQNATCVCPETCATEPSPVCGTDGQTYASRCQLEVMACREQKDIMVRAEGVCESE